MNLRHSYSGCIPCIEFKRRRLIIDVVGREMAARCQRIVEGSGINKRLKTEPGWRRASVIELAQSVIGRQ